METKLPWAERFRPDNLDDIVSHNHIKETFKNYVEYKTFPHLLFYGPSGTGKTSTINAFAKELYGDQFELMVLEINASEERGIDVVRSKIRDFVITRANFFGDTMSLFKLVILDEADAMTNEAQAMLRRVIETHTDNARFCLICNYKSKIIDAIQSRCTMFKFPPLDKKSILKRVESISLDQNINVTKCGVDMLVKISKGDMRKLLNIFQSVSMLDKAIDSEFVSVCLGYPGLKDMEYIEKILQGKNIEKNLKKLEKYITDNGFAIQNIITELTEMIYKEVISENINVHKANNILKGLADIEVNLCHSPNISIQLATLVSIYFISYNI